MERAKKEILLNLGINQNILKKILDMKKDKEYEIRFTEDIPINVMLVLHSDHSFDKYNWDEPSKVGVISG